MLQKRSRASPELQDFQLPIHHNSWRAVAAQKKLVDLSLQLGGQRPVHVHARSVIVARFPVHVETQIRRSGRGLARVHFLLLIDWLKKIDCRADALRDSQHQVPGRLQAIVKQAHEFLLQNGRQINQNVAADNQVELRKRRILRDILARENTELPHLPRDLKAAVDLGEKSPQAVR